MQNSISKLITVSIVSPLRIFFKLYSKIKIWQGKSQIKQGAVLIKTEKHPKTFFNQLKIKNKQTNKKLKIPNNRLVNFRTLNLKIYICLAT